MGAGASFGKEPIPVFDQTVVVVGGGYGGVQVASLLDAHFNVILIEKREVFVHGVAALRALVRGQEWANKIVIPYDKLLPRGRVIQGEVVDVLWDQRVKLADGEAIKFDHLVLAVGVSQRILGRPSSVVFKSTEIKAYYQQISEQIAKAIRILVIGGGPLGVELAAEIRTIHPLKEITIVHTGPSLMNGNKPPPPKEFSPLIMEKLEKMNIKVILQDTVVVSDPHRLIPGHRTLSITRNVKLNADLILKAPHRIIPGNRTLSTTRNVKLNVDLILKAVGFEKHETKLQANLKEKMDHLGSFKVNSLLQVPSLLNTWAIGDCATGEMKTAAAAIANANLVFQNIVHYVQGKPLIEYKCQALGWMNSVLGEDDGLGYVGHKIRKSDDALIQKKCHDLNVSAWWTKLKQKQEKGALQSALSTYGATPSEGISGAGSGGGKKRKSTGAWKLFGRGFWEASHYQEDQLII